MHHVLKSRHQKLHVHVRKDEEKVDMKEYAKLMTQHNPAISVRQSGLVLRREYPTFLNHPNVVSGCPCRGKRLVETNILRVLHKHYMSPTGIPDCK